jgi:hypothetical protein
MIARRADVSFRKPITKRSQLSRLVVNVVGWAMPTLQELPPLAPKCGGIVEWCSRLVERKRRSL